MKALSSQRTPKFDLRRSGFGLRRLACHGVAEGEDGTPLFPETDKARDKEVERIDLIDIESRARLLPSRFFAALMARTPDAGLRTPYF